MDIEEPKELGTLVRVVYITHFLGVPIRADTIARLGDYDSSGEPNWYALGTEFTLDWSELIRDAESIEFLGVFEPVHEELE